MVHVRVACLSLALLLVACPEAPEAAPPQPVSPEASEEPAATPEPVRPPGPEIIAADKGGASVQQQVKAALDGAGERQLVVYVGATWCEPCRRFHDAVVAGQLDDALSGVRFLEFDHDVHQEGLKAAGYVKRFVPLFAIPNPDGTASERVHQGAIKGAGAVDFILPRLRSLLTEAP